MTITLGVELTNKLSIIPVIKYLLPFYLSDLGPNGR